MESIRMVASMDNMHGSMGRSASGSVFNSVYASVWVSLRASMWDSVKESPCGNPCSARLGRRLMDKMVSVMWQEAVWKPFRGLLDRSVNSVIGRRS